MILISTDDRKIRRFGLIGLIFFGCLCTVGLWNNKPLPVFLFGFLIYVFVRNDFTYFEIIAFSTIIGGGIGNLYDRVFRSGYVGDFINIGIGPVRTGVFNIADVAIMIGSAMLLYRFIGMFMKHRKITHISNE